MKNWKGAERRKCRRFEIPGAEVVFKKIGLFGLFSRFSNPCYLLNLSKGGVAFSTNVILKPGQKVLIRLLLPNAHPVTLRGQVSWQNGFGFGQVIATGVKFMPFGDRRGWNSRKTLEVLNRLEKAYGEKETSSKELEEHLF